MMTAFPKPTRTHKPRKPLRSKYARRPRDLDYLAWVRTLPCCAPGMFACGWRAEAHHAGARGLGQKAGDHTAIPLCRIDHDHLHNATGTFAGWTKAQRRAWQDKQAALTLDRYLRRAPGGVF